jgi:uncharacterized membrane protein
VLIHWRINILLGVLTIMYLGIRLVILIRPVEVLRKRVLMINNFNIFKMDYIFYKLYRASQRSSIPEIAGLLAELIFTICLSFNVLAIIALLKKMEVIDFFPSKTGFIIISAGIFIVTTLLFFTGCRYKRIIEKYEVEEKKSRFRGNFLVTMYVILSFAFLLGGAFYRPGIL